MQRDLKPSSVIGTECSQAKLLCCCTLLLRRFEVPTVLCVAGGLDEALYNVIAMAREQEIPFVFALGRKALGRCVNKLVPVSVVGIFNYSGAEVEHRYHSKILHFSKFLSKYYSGLKKKKSSGILETGLFVMIFFLFVILFFLSLRVSSIVWCH